MLRSVAIIGSLATVLCACTADAQEAVLSQTYGSGVHAYFSGDHRGAVQHMSSAIEGGIDDPRAFFFRGLSYSRLGRPQEAQADFARGAKLELSNRDRFYDVSLALERVQGRPRIAIERVRSQARLEALAAANRVRQQRYEQIQQTDAEVLLKPVPDMLVDPADLPPPPTARAEDVPRLPEDASAPPASNDPPVDASVPPRALMDVFTRALSETLGEGEAPADAADEAASPFDFEGFDEAMPDDEFPPAADFPADDSTLPDTAPAEQPPADDQDPFGSFDAPDGPLAPPDASEPIDAATPDSTAPGFTAPEDADIEFDPFTDTAPDAAPEVPDDGTAPEPVDDDPFGP